MVAATSTRWRLLVSGGTVGFGFGAVIDAMIFHVTLQTHHLLSGFYDPYSLDGLRTNVMVDGLFLLVMLGVMVAGLGGLWRTVNGAAERFSTRYLVGAVVVGMGVFNVIDGVVSHYVLDIHNVVHGTEAWNPPWVAISVLLLVVGLGVLWTADGHRAP
ncbi:DUF2243 domain-containing protein [Natronorubrum aibiense]|uniref:DUF2243 domain-containing protein n=1 Tax=Natronorubrum aibiense TaxID=348826 RepID=A0A5P9P5Q1_9EURY|nr:DUF2243 domain-containing protein [Natronorubrum aibiense]QFU83458.1 DUF2243 domain-containing protein [Natronorubrum aibiense]